VTHQHAPQVVSIKPALWRDLNVFVAAFIGIIGLGSFAVFVPLSLLAKLVLPSRQAELVAYPLGYALVALGLAYLWRKRGLSPREVDPARKTRFRVGHILLAVFNCVLLLMLVLPQLGIHTVLPRIVNSGKVVGLLASLITLAPMDALVGVYMVWTARGAAPDFADTLPAGQVAPRKTPSAKWPPDTDAPRNPPSVIVALAGLVVSSLMLFVFGVFAALSFAGNTKLFENTVLPIAIGVYVLYVATTLFVLFKRSRAAIWLAWGPVILVTVVGPLVQVIGLLIWR
jgi:hypothetical protein